MELPRPCVIKSVSHRGKINVPQVEVHFSTEIYLNLRHIFYGL